MKGRIKSGAAVIIARTAAVLGVTLAIVLLFLLGAMWVVARGPSPEAG